MPEVKMYKTTWCGFCDRATRLLAHRGVTDITEVNIEQWDDGFAKLYELTGGKSVPQIYIGERHIGGFDELVALDRTGELQELLAG